MGKEVRKKETVHYTLASACSTVNFQWAEIT